jgi:hypothetical protein
MVEDEGLYMRRKGYLERESVHLGPHSVRNQRRVRTRSRACLLVPCCSHLCLFIALSCGLQGSQGPGTESIVPFIFSLPAVKPGNVRNIIQHFENSHQYDVPEPGTQRLSTGSFPEDLLESDR